MAALLWLLIPVAGGVVASVWGGWAARRRVVVPDAAGVAGYERFRAAMERSRTDAPAAPDASSARVPADAAAPAAPREDAARQAP
jgi:hypothetical protein